MSGIQPATETYEHNQPEPHTHHPKTIPQYLDAVADDTGPQPHTTVTCACGAQGTTTFVPGHLLVEWNR